MQNKSVSAPNDNQKMEAIDFVIALILVARMVYEKKILLVFEVCDDDRDGSLTPDDVLDMFERVERVAARDCSRTNLNK